MMIYAMVIYKLPTEKIFFCYSGYCIMMFLMCAYALISNSKLSSSLKLTFVINLMKYTSLAVTFICIWLYFIGMFHYIIVLLILIGNIVVMAIRLSLASLPRTYVDGHIGDFMEAIQFLLIALKLLGFIQCSWGWTLLIYSIFVTFMVFLGVIGAFFLPIMLGMSTFHSANSSDRKTLLFASWIFFHLSWKAITFYYLYQNFLIFLNRNGLYPRTTVFVTNYTLIPICYFFFFGGLINYFWFHQQRELFSRIIALKLMVISRNKGVKREIIEIPFDMKIMKAGTNYFKKLISTRKLPETFDITKSVTDENGQLSECMICCTNKSNTLIRPCNHGGICESCIITYLGTNNSCPNCKVEITKIYVMEYDQELRKFYGTKVLSLIK